MRKRLSEPKTSDGGEDPRNATLLRSVVGLRAQLAQYPARLRDRELADEELAVLERTALQGVPPPDQLRRSLLVLAAALGSVSALAPALTEVRVAVELFGEPEDSKVGSGRG
ncbi:DUF5955 family protein [Streptomyces sp. NPDC005438]|uniref:DUF5955 family protein n=1 Tax=Streptomyces sp. NPDC005438 TaxID=3156880 RepID=UPI0033A2C585